MKSYGIKSSKSYAMDTDWIGSGIEEPWKIFEESVPKLMDIISDINFYLDKVLSYYKFLHLNILTSANI